MTEYWVSQGNKWCEHCKIYIANNPISIRTHEFGQRHKDNVAKKLATIRKETAVKEKEKKQAIKDLERIESQAKKSYEKDMAAAKKVVAGGHSNTVPPPPFSKGSSEWTLNGASVYYYNAASGYYHDANSGLYYSDSTGKWCTREACIAACDALPSKEEMKKGSRKTAEEASEGSATKQMGRSLPGPVVKNTSSSSSLVRGVSSSLELGKRKRDGKKAPMSSDELAALQAREAARKRTEEREKSLLGLYQSY